jgi:hypothetical protein
VQLAFIYLLIYLYVYIYSNLGYDTFRMWELLTLGSIVVIERGIGFDRTLWRLPALLVDDFDDVTPELLHSAYVEALYRADDFEFNRLKQSFWWDVIYNVSVSMSIDPLLHFFPMEGMYIYVYLCIYLFIYLFKHVYVC